MQFNLDYIQQGHNGHEVKRPKNENRDTFGENPIKKCKTNEINYTKQCTEIFE